MFTILVAEDDKALNTMLCAKLKQENYSVFSAYDGEEALEIMDQEHIDLLVCDIMMPNMDGYTLTKELRDASYMLPILMITAKDQLEDMEQGFVVGTDDYMIKPIRLKEMAMRVKALLRRAQIANERKLVVGNTVLDYDAVSITTESEGEHMTVTLPKKEFYLLFKLLSNPNKIFTRQQLLDEIWGMETEIEDRIVDAYIKKLRRKVEDSRDFTLVTVRGLGYKAVLS